MNDHAPVATIPTDGSRRRKAKHSVREVGPTALRLAKGCQSWTPFEQEASATRRRGRRRRRMKADTKMAQIRIVKA
eukprot:3947953-Pyramimonas_sp.AAC.1